MTMVGKIQNHFWIPKWKLRDLKEKNIYEENLKKPDAIWKIQGKERILECLVLQKLRTFSDCSKELQSFQQL